MRAILTSPALGKAIAIAVLFSAAAGASPVDALEEQAGETQALKSCEERLCTMLLRKEPVGDDLKCELTKTWAKSTIKSADTKTLKWGFGDARCSVKLSISRTLVVEAMTREDFKLHVPQHTATCVVEENGQLKPMKATLAPKIVFKNGQAEKVWVNLIDIEGSTAIGDTLRAAAYLEDKLGLFHRPMIKSINRFIYKHCVKSYPQALISAASAAAKPKNSKPAGPR
jgi:hypothetical protein